MYYNTPNFDKNNKPVCEICKCSFDRLLLHVNHRHGLTATQYKAKYNYHPRKGIQSKALRSKMSRSAKKNYNTVIMPNLIISGQETRFQDGNTKTDKEKVSTASKKRMLAYWKEKKESERESKQEIISRLSQALYNLRVNSPNSNLGAIPK